jgi:hypothetical protein
MSVFSVLNEYISHNEELNRTQFSVGVKMNRLDAQVGTGFTDLPPPLPPPIFWLFFFLLFALTPFFTSFPYRCSSFCSFSLLLSPFSFFFYPLLLSSFSSFILFFCFVSLLPSFILPLSSSFSTRLSQNSLFPYWITSSFYLKNFHFSSLSSFLLSPSSFSVSLRSSFLTSSLFSLYPYLNCGFYGSFLGMSTGILPFKTFPILSRSSNRFSHRLFCFVFVTFYSASFSSSLTFPVFIKAGGLRLLQCTRFETGYRRRLPRRPSLPRPLPIPTRYQCCGSGMIFFRS